MDIRTLVRLSWKRNITKEKKKESEGGKKSNARNVGPLFISLRSCECQGKCELTSNHDNNELNANFGAVSSRNKEMGAIWSPRIMYSIHKGKITIVRVTSQRTYIPQSLAPARRKPTNSRLADYERNRIESSRQSKHSPVRKWRVANSEFEWFWKIQLFALRTFIEQEFPQKEMRS